MSWSRFDTRASAKWVLAGEHAVLRGSTAIALPHPEMALALKFEPGRSDALEVIPATANAVITEILESIQDDQQSEDRVFALPGGRLEIQSSIPVGAGMGSSAALCVAMGRWLAEPLGLGCEQVLEFATRIEHRFHGRSSGVDIAVIAAGEPISFVIPREGQPGRATSLGIKRLPKFTFHDMGLRTRTSECVLRVEKLREADPALAIRIDEEMSAASRSAMEGLVRYDADPASQKGLELIANAMRRGQECFYSWQLVPGAAKRIEEDLLSQGALAVKMTGAGGGGMLVALWPQDR